MVQCQSQLRRNGLVESTGHLRTEHRRTDRSPARRRGNRRAFEPGEHRVPVLPDKLEEPSKELAELAALVFDLVVAMAEWVPEDRLEELRARAQGAARAAALTKATEALATGGRRTGLARCACAAGRHDGQCRPIEPARSARRWPRRAGPDPSTVLRQCPNTSRLMGPIDVVQAWSAQHHRRDRQAREQTLGHRRHGGAQLRPTHGGGDVPVDAEPARLLAATSGRTRAAATRRVRLDRVLGSLVAGDRGAEDQAPLVGVLEGPVRGALRNRPASARRRRPPSPFTSRLVRPPAPPRRPAPRRRRGSARSEGVAAVEVAVERGGCHPQVAGDGAQGEGGGALTGEVLPRPRPGSPPSSPPGPAPGPCGRADMGPV